MGADITAAVQRRDSQGWKTVDLPEAVSDALHTRNSSIFVALGHRPGTAPFPLIAPAGRGWPQGEACHVGEEQCDYSYVTLQELEAYDWLGPAWQQVFWSFGEAFPLHQRTEQWREVVLPYLRSLGTDEVRILFCFDQ